MTSFTATEGLAITDSHSEERVALERQFDRLVAEHRFALARLAGAYARAPGDREDILQDIAVAIWQALPSFRNECSERTFIFRIAHNRAVTWLARNTAYRMTEEVRDLPDATPGAEATLLQEEEQNRLARAVRALPVDYRQVVLLTLEGMSYAEVATVLGITEVNVGARLTRARQMLRRLLEGTK